MDKKIGLIAGGGAFPLLFAREAKNLGYAVFVIGLKGITPEEIERYAAATEYFKLGGISAPIDFLKKAGVDKVLMAGKVPHVSIFGGIMPDLRAAKLLLTLKDRKANSLLGALADELKKDGIELVNSATFLEHLMPAPGILSGRRPDKDAMQNIEFGWKAAKTLAGLDIGLTVVLKDRVVIAAEAQEGTDECIKRAGAVLRAGGAEAGKKLPGLAVVKVARPDQDMRFDLPVVGSTTLESMREAGAAILAIEAEKTLILDKEDFLAKAADYGITVAAMESGEFPPNG
jgi:DUF1009 family protein